MQRKVTIVILITYEWRELSLKVSCELLCAFQVRTALHKFRGHFDFSKLCLKITRSSSCAGDVQMRLGPCFQEALAASLIGDIATTRRRLHSWYTSPRSDCAPCNSRLRLAPAIVTRADASSSNVASASLMAREPGPSSSIMKRHGVAVCALIAVSEIRTVVMVARVFAEVQSFIARSRTWGTTDECA